MRDVNCPKCGAENLPEQKFCNECAAPFKALREMWIRERADREILR